MSLQKRVKEGLKLHQTIFFVLTMDQMKCIILKRLLIVTNPQRIITIYAALWKILRSYSSTF